MPRELYKLSAGRGFDCVLELTGAQRARELAAAKGSLVTDDDPKSSMRMSDR